MLKQLLFAALALPWLCAGPAAAQVAPAAAASAQEAAPAAAEEEAIVVEGRRDRAMRAFLSGDYATAEIEFGKNLGCIQRVETLRSFAFEQVQTDALRAEISANIGFAGPSLMPVTAQTSSYTERSRRERIPERTCEQPDWQLYMIGLSQIGLGRRTDAKETLYRVVRMSKNSDLFDAHYKVGLLELLDGNIDEADRRLTHLRRMQRICDRRGDACEIKPELDYSVAYLTFAIDAARRGELRRE